MKFNFSKPLVAHNGEAINEPAEDGVKPVTLGRAIELAIGMSEIRGPEKIDAWKILQATSKLAVHLGSPGELTAEQVTKLKKWAADSNLSVVACGALCDALEAPAE